ncbi:MAG: sensor domain-containing diguanylate cyclase [Roseiflexus sp.]|nr:sensor domain-containing diguanylate cyclase [Roseiflexus sp.]MDW8233460.1 sensor domain-containing diguanylate cyclase [Roseiflexaceae bacterium]
MQDLQGTASSGSALSASDDHYLVALHETALAIMSRLDLRDVLEAIMVHATRLAGTSDGYIDLLSPDGTQMEMQIGIGWHAEHCGGPIGVGEGVSGRVWQTGQPMIVRDYRNWEGRIRSMDTSDLGTVVAVPLKSGSAVIGVLGVTYYESYHPAAETVVKLLMRFAELAAIAIDNARLYTTLQEELTERRRIEAELRESEQQMRHLYSVTRRQAQELHLIGQVREAIAREIDLPALFRTIVESIAATFGYTLVCLYLRDGDDLILQHQVGYLNHLDRIPLGKGIMSRTILSGQPILVANVRSDPDFIGVTDNIVSEICVPLRDQDRVIGALTIESIDGVVLTEDDLRLMIELAGHINVAIERARLYEQLWRRVQQLDALYDTMSDITGNLDRDAVLKAIVERMVALMRATHGAIALYDLEQQNLRIHYSVGLDRDYTGVRLALGEGVIGHVALTRRPMVVYDYAQWEGRSPLFRTLPSSNVLAVPLLAGDELIGALSAGDFNTRRVFTDDDVRLLSMFAQQATIAIKNARLFAEVQLLAVTDPLMGIYNRRYFFSAAVREYERARRHHHSLAVLIADLDNFKQINDRYGHPIGDQVLQTVSGIFRRELRSIDLLARYGGEEIIMLLPETDCGGVIRVVERLQSRLMDPVISECDEIRVTVSFGAAVNQRVIAPNVEALITYADQALLYAKQHGKNRLVVWCDMCDVAGSCPYLSPDVLHRRVTILPLMNHPSDETA